MTVTRGPIALEISGMPASHARCFQKVADQTQCVISSRAVGKYATGLLLENYATKGFHDKAKSCNWGPMAGFVMADTRFTKRGGALEDQQSQAKDLADARKHGADETPLYITDARRLAVEKMGCATRVGGNINLMTYVSTSPSGGTMHFVLKRVLDGPGAQGKQLWLVCYAPDEVVVNPRLNQIKEDGLRPLLAMVDPACPPEVRKTYRAATTGDYDLFAVFPPHEKFQPKGLDARPVPNSERLKIPISEYIKHEDKHMGNITGRVRLIKDQINRLVKTLANYSGGDVVHHSDEAGRPKVSNIDFPFIAFVPGWKEPAIVRNSMEMRTFISLLIPKYQITFNPGWHRELGFGTSAGGYYEV